MGSLNPFSTPQTLARPEVESFPCSTVGPEFDIGSTPDSDISFRDTPPHRRAEGNRSDSSSTTSTMLSNHQLVVMIRLHG